MDRLLASLLASPIVFSLGVLVSRAPARRVAAALAGGLLFSAGNLAWDVAAARAGWRAYRRAGARGLVAFAAAFAILCVVRDLGVASGPDPAIVFAPGPGPRLADATAAFTLILIAVGAQLALGGDARRLRSSWTPGRRGGVGAR